MTQKLLVMERDTKEELEDAIRKHLEDSRFRVIGFSVLEQSVEVIIDGQHGFDPDGRHKFEAWIIIEDAHIGGIE